VQLVGAEDAALTLTLALPAPAEDAAMLGGQKESAQVHRESFRDVEGEGREEDGVAELIV